MMNEKRVYQKYSVIEEGYKYIKFIKPEDNPNSKINWWEVEVYDSNVKYTGGYVHVLKWVEEDEEYERVPLLRAKLLGIV